MMHLRIPHGLQNASCDRFQGRRGVIHEYSEAREQPLGDSLDKTNGTHFKDGGAKVKGLT